MLIRAQFILLLLRSTMATAAKKPRIDFPDTLLGFGYKFNDAGQLTHVHTGEGFKFEVEPGKQSYNQKHYEALGEVLNEHIYGLMEEKCQMKRLPVPKDAKEGDPQSFVFINEDALNKSKLLVLIHGSGVVRAGQWARRLIINDKLQSGTQIPFIEKATEEDFGVIVLNTNDNHRMVNNKKVPIKDSDGPETHANYVWKTYIKDAAAQHIAIIAHSYGGIVAKNLYEEYKSDFEKRVFAIALTDSVHMPSEATAKLSKVARNWVGSQYPLNNPVKTRPGDIEKVSAGVLQHELTSWSSFTSVFSFILDRYSKRVKKTSTEEKSPVLQSEL